MGRRPDARLWSHDGPDVHRHQRRFAQVVSWEARLVRSSTWFEKLATHIGCHRGAIRASGAMQKGCPSN